MQAYLFAAPVTGARAGLGIGRAPTDKANLFGLAQPFLLVYIEPLYEAQFCGYISYNVPFPGWRFGSSVVNTLLTANAKTS